MVAIVTFVTSRSNYLTPSHFGGEGYLVRHEAALESSTYICQSGRCCIRPAMLQSRLPKREYSPIHFLRIFSLFEGWKRNPTSGPEYQRGDAFSEK
jgi:hypothetical protein